MLCPGTIVTRPKGSEGKNDSRVIALRNHQDIDLVRSALVQAKIKEEEREREAAASVSGSSRAAQGPYATRVCILGAGPRGVEIAGLLKGEADYVTLIDSEDHVLEILAQGIYINT